VASMVSRGLIYWRDLYGSLWTIFPTCRGSGGEDRGRRDAGDWTCSRVRSLAALLALQNGLVLHTRMC
jgi:hypothetical protein